MIEQMDQATATMVKNLEEKTGKSFEQLVAHARANGPKKHKDLINYLKAEHDLTYGYANLIALYALKPADAPPDTDDSLVEEQYAGEKAAMRPVYEAVIAAVQGFGDDVEIAPKKTYVSLRRKKQFAIVQATTKNRVDLGINMKNVAPQGRLEASGSFNSMVSHRVRLEQPSQVDEELIAWLKAAYENA
jgi:hypothetical protein